MKDVTEPTGSSLPGTREPLPLEAGLGFRLSRLGRTLRADWAEQLDELGLTPPQAAIVRAIVAQPGPSLRALARTLGAEPMRVKRCVDELEARGLLHSAHRGDDRRPRALALSPKGLELAGRVEFLVRRQESRLTMALGAELRVGLEAGLGALEDHLGLGTSGPVPLTGGGQPAQVTPESSYRDERDATTAPPTTAPPMVDVEAGAIAPAEVAP